MMSEPLIDAPLVSLLTSQFVVVFLHGGPGGSTSKANTTFFDPEVYRVVLYDQRGCGQSTPSAELRENTTSHLVADIEVLRNHLKVPKWHMVFGGSWGSTLGLRYAQTHPQSVGSLVLRGIFLCRVSEIEWSRPTPGFGAARAFPEEYEKLMAYLPEEDRGSMIDGYYKLLTSTDRQTQVDAARMMNTWDIAQGSVVVDPSAFDKITDEKWSLEHAILEMHYVKHLAWMEDGEILRDENMARIRHIPGKLTTLIIEMPRLIASTATIIQGRYDIVCPPITAWDLHKAWPESKLIWVAGAGHSASVSRRWSYKNPD